MFVFYFHGCSGGSIDFLLFHSRATQDLDLPDSLVVFDIEFRADRFTCFLLFCNLNGLSERSYNLGEYFPFGRFYRVNSKARRKSHGGDKNKIAEGEGGCDESFHYGIVLPKTLRLALCRNSFGACLSHKTLI